LNIVQTAHPGIAMSMELLGVGEAAFHGFLAPLINPLAPRFQTMAVHSVPRRLPDMPRHHLHPVLTARTLPPQGTSPADLRIGVVLPIALAGGGAILQPLLVGTDIHITPCIVAKLVFAKQPFSMIGPPIPRHSVNPPLFQPLRQGRRRVTRIQPN